MRIPIAALAAATLLSCGPPDRDAAIVPDEAVESITAEALATVRALEAAEHLISTDPTDDPSRRRALVEALVLVRRALAHARENAEALGYLER